VTGSEASELRYNQVVEDNLNAVWRVARRAGVHPNHLDDVLQEVFLIVARKLHSIEPRAERAFVAAVTLRVAANFNRSLQRKPEDPVEWLDELPAMSRVPFEPLERHQGLQLLQQALGLMTEAQREVFILSELEQHTAPEIAVQLGVDEACVVSRLRRSREVFRRFCESQQRVRESAQVRQIGVR
jgi:RNA polymerase sigma factor (sigma-70 family)